MVPDVPDETKNVPSFIALILGEFFLPIGLHSLPQPYRNPPVIGKKSRIGAFIEILGKMEDGEFAGVGLPLPRAENGAGTALVAEGVDMDDLKKIVHADLHRHG